MATNYTYSASKSNGKFYGAVYATVGGDNPSEQIATIDGIRTQRGVKSFVKAVAQLHKKENLEPASHTETAYVNGFIQL